MRSFCLAFPCAVSRRVALCRVCVGPRVGFCRPGVRCLISTSCSFYDSVPEALELGPFKRRSFVGHLFLRRRNQSRFPDPQGPQEIREARHRPICVGFLVISRVTRPQFAAPGRDEKDAKSPWRPRAGAGSSVPISNSRPSPQPPGCDPPRLQEGPHIPVPLMYDHGRRASTTKTQNMGVGSGYNHNLLSSNGLSRAAEAAPGNTCAGGGATNRRVARKRVRS